MGINKGRIRKMKLGETITDLILKLEEIKDNEDLLIKIYFVDKDNFTIKFINAEGQKVHTIRRNKDNKFKARDCKWREKNEKEKV